MNVFVSTHVKFGYYAMNFSFMQMKKTKQNIVVKCSLNKCVLEAKWGRSLSNELHIQEQLDLAAPSSK